jgi:3-methyladenine DNA glycosylase AlkD
MNYKELVKYLFDNRDEKYGEFTKKISNSDYKTIGIRLPMLRKIIKDLTSDSELKLEEFEVGKYQEIDIIYFVVNVNRLKDNKDKLAFLEREVHKARSWAVTDSIAVYFKKLSFDDYYDFFKKVSKSKYVYARRMGYVLGLKFARDKNILKTFTSIKENEEYMVMMGEAWLIATVAIYYPDECYEYLLSLNDMTLKRKVISKMVDSYRISSEIKEKFKLLRE